MGCVLDESGRGGKKVDSGRRVVFTIRPLVNAKSVQLECITGSSMMLCMVDNDMEGEREIWD